MEPSFGVTHRRGIVAIDAAEVALAVDKRIAQGERLRHADERIIDCKVSVGMELAQHLSHHACAFLVRLAGQQPHLAHREEDAAMDRFQAVANIRQRASDDDGHRVVEIRALHLLLDETRSLPVRRGWCSVHGWKKRRFCCSSEHLAI